MTFPFISRPLCGAVAMGLVVLAGCELSDVNAWLDSGGLGSSSSREQRGGTERSTANGFEPRTYVDEQGREHRYAVFIPLDYEPGDRPPVLMFLNGMGENGEDGVSQLSNNMGLPVWEMQEFFPFLLVAPQCSVSGSWDPRSADTQWALAILDAVIDEFGADEDRIYLTGVSSGGGGVWNIGSAYPERFAALAPMAGGGGDLQALAAESMPIWNFWNESDAAGLVEGNRNQVTRLFERGASPLGTGYTTDPTPSILHDCWNRGYRTTALYRWLLEQNRTERGTEPPFKLLTADQILATWHASAGGTWSVSDNGSLTGVGETAAEPGMLICDARGRNVELHGDVWLTAGSVCQLVLLGDEPMASSPQLRLEIPLPEEGTGGVQLASGEWIARLSPDAQRTLQPDAWNEVRARFAGRSLQVRLNGWPAVDVRLEADGPADQNHRWALVAPAPGSEIRWRHLRARAWPDAND